MASMLLYSQLPILCDLLKAVPPSDYILFDKGVVLPILPWGEIATHTNGYGYQLYDKILYYLPLDFIARGGEYAFLLNNLHNTGINNFHITQLPAYITHFQKTCIPLPLEYLFASSFDSLLTSSSFSSLHYTTLVGIPKRLRPMQDILFIVSLPLEVDLKLRNYIGDEHTTLPSALKQELLENIHTSQLKISLLLAEEEISLNEPYTYLNKFKTKRMLHFISIGKRRESQ